MSGETLSIVPASEGEVLAEVMDLFREYAGSLGVDLAYQGFEAELAGLPGRYAPPRGTILLARRGAEAVGCAAVRPLDAGDCEMKRLYVRPGGRAIGMGRRLAEAAVAFATSAGYRRILLDTLPTMTAAIGLYRALGFAPIEPYSSGPPGTLHFARGLSSPEPTIGTATL